MKKPSLAVVIGVGKPKPGVESAMGKDMAKADESEGMEYSDEQKAMAEELMSAVKSGDSSLFLDAFHGLFQSYEGMPHKEYEE